MLQHLQRTRYQVRFYANNYFEYLPIRPLQLTPWVFIPHGYHRCHTANQTYYDKALITPMQMFWQKLDTGKGDQNLHHYLGV